MKILIEVIEKESIPYNTNTPACVIFRSKHSNCEGCPTEIAYSKYIAIQVIILQTTLYIPKDFEDSLKTHKLVGEKIAQIIKMKTEDEIVNAL